MIQPNELRIGNLVKSSGTDIEGHPGYKHEVVVVVEDVLSDGINLYYERAIYDLDSLSGIPLTPEWLKRFGFIETQK